MIIKKAERFQAIRLRKAGWSYNEILSKVNVSKSTLSVWLRNIGLAEPQKQRLTEKKRISQKKAQEAWHALRVKRELDIIQTAQKAIKKISQREFWLIGVALYWAEGSKQKTHLVSQKVCFSNSDPNMVLFFDKWLRVICKRKSEEIVYSIYIHKTGDIIAAKRFWSRLLNTNIERVYFKPSALKTKRKNTGKSYHGLLRIEVRKSTALNRQIRGWTLGIIEKVK